MIETVRSHANKTDVGETWLGLLNCGMVHSALLPNKKWRCFNVPWRDVIGQWFVSVLQPDGGAPRPPEMEPASSKVNYPAAVLLKWERSLNFSDWDWSRSHAAVSVPASRKYYSRFVFHLVRNQHNQFFAIGTLYVALSTQRTTSPWVISPRSRTSTAFSGDRVYVDSRSAKSA